MRILISIFLLLILPESLSARLPDLIPYRKGNLWGYCDSTKKIVIEPQWESCCLFSEGRAVVQKKGKLGLIDSLGNYLVPPKYSDLTPLGRTRYLASQGEYHEGLIDDHDSVLVPLKARWITLDADSVLGCVMPDEVFICDYNGKAILEKEYVVLDDGLGGAAQFGLFVVIPKAHWKKRDKECMGYIVVDTADRQVLPGSYDHIQLLGDSVFECEGPDTTCYFDLKGNPAADPYTVDVRLRGPISYYTGIKVQSIPYVHWHWQLEACYTNPVNGESQYLGLKDQYGTQYWED